MKSILFQACLRGPWVAVVFFAVALGFSTDPLPYEGQLPAATRVPGWVTDPRPVRQPAVRPAYRVASFTYRCSECHGIIPSPRETDRSLTQHREIVLAHGINTRCFNCHHRTDRDAFVDDLGAPIPWDQPQLLCAKCHGPVYRDWQHGSHGRVNGFWDTRRGPQTRRQCIECHDPHAPPFPPMTPAPGPNTLRMGLQHAPGHAEGHDPLRVRAVERGARPSSLSHD
jgi:hypothetical protein